MCYTQNTKKEKVKVSLCTDKISFFGSPAPLISDVLEWKRGLRITRQSTTDNWLASVPRYRDADWSIVNLRAPWH